MKIKNRTLALAASLALLAGLSACSSTEPAPEPTPTETTQARPTNGTYTLTDVQAHAVKTDCWTTINMKVYDLTEWVDYHPGGPDYIGMLCGKDGSAMFASRHAGQPAPEEALGYYVIGTLTDSPAAGETAAAPADSTATGTPAAPSDTPGE